MPIIQVLHFLLVYIFAESAITELGKPLPSQIRILESRLLEAAGSEVSPMPSAHRVDCCAYLALPSPAKCS